MTREELEALGYIFRFTTTLLEVYHRGQPGWGPPVYRKVTTLTLHQQKKIVGRLPVATPAQLLAEAVKAASIHFVKQRLKGKTYDTIPAPDPTDARQFFAKQLLSEYRTRFPELAWLHSRKENLDPAATVPKVHPPGISDASCIFTKLLELSSRSNKSAARAGTQRSGDADSLGSKSARNAGKR